MTKIKNFGKKPLDADWDALDNTGIFKAFLQKAFRYADTICLTYNRTYDQFLKSEWSFLKDSVIDYESTSETPVTITKGPNVLLIYLRIDETTKEWLQGKNGIGDFQSKVSALTWLDDLCFVKNGETVFCSCTHERFCLISEDSAAYLLNHQYNLQGGRSL